MSMDFNDNCGIQLHISQLDDLESHEMESMEVRSLESDIWDGDNTFEKNGVKSDLPIHPTSTSNSHGPESAKCHAIGNTPNLGICNQSNIYNTTVEQPDTGPGCCFVCGCLLAVQGDQFIYLDSQPLFNSQLSVLELMSAVLEQWIVTNTSEVSLCPRCSELINDTDATFVQMGRLKRQLGSFFNNNQRPKLTCQILQKSDFKALQNSSKPVKPLKSLEFPSAKKHKSKPIIQDSKLETPKAVPPTHVSHSELNTTVAAIKRGRPRKPFSCHICKRRFLLKDLVISHMMREHEMHPTSLAKTVITDGQTPSPQSPAQIPVSEIPQLVKQETAEEPSDSHNPNNTDQSADILAAIPHKFLSSLQIKGTSEPSYTTTCMPGMRRIQPKPETLIQTNPDGSVLVFMNPSVPDSSPSVIRVTPGYLNLKPNVLPCPKCPKTFPDEKSRRAHSLTFHSQSKKKRVGQVTELIKPPLPSLIPLESCHEKLPCDQCTDMFSCHQSLLEHCQAVHETSNNGQHKNDSIGEQTLWMSSVDPPGLHECSVCSLRVASKAALTIHLQRYHRSFSSSSQVTSSKDYLCSECGHLASSRKAFQDHQRTHSDVPGPKRTCLQCGKVMLVTSFRIHMLRMHGEAKHSCNNCDQKFTVRSALTRHFNAVHSSLRPYDCKECGEKFVTSDALRYHHNKLHSTTVYNCEFCSRTFRQKTELNVHIARFHSTTRKTFTCPVCERHYSEKRKLRHHMSMKHSQEAHVYDRDNYDIEQEMESDDLSPTKSLLNVVLGRSEVPTSSYQPQGSMIGAHHDTSLQRPNYPTLSMHHHLPPCPESPPLYHHFSSVPSTSPSHLPHSPSHLHHSPSQLHHSLLSSQHFQDGNPVCLVASLIGLNQSDLSS